MIPSARSTHAVRPLLPALIALLGAVAIGCAGGGSSSSHPGSGSASTSGSKSRVWKPGVPDTAGPIVAIVGNRRVTRHEIDSLILMAPPSIQPGLREFGGYKDVVDRVVTEEAMVTAARMSGVDQDSGYKADMRRAERELLARRYWDLKQRRLPAISDSALHAYYDTHQDEFTMGARSKIRHIALPTRSKALQVRKSLVKGALWDEICLKQSIDKATRENGGLLGYVGTEGGLVPGVGKSPAIAAAAFALPIDEISQPLKGPTNWHLIRVESRDEKTVRPYEEARGRIKARLESEQRDNYGRVFADSIKAMANAVIFDDSIRIALRPAKTASDLFKEAQSAATPLQRIQLYRDLVKDFPKDSIAVQAEFMVGFTYAEELGDYESAKTEFESFVKNHPGTELATSAQWMIDNMEKPAPPLEGEEDQNAPKDDGSKSGGTKGNGTDSVPDSSPGTAPR